MRVRRSLAAATAAATSAALLAVVAPPATAGPLGAAETVVSGATTAGGVGEAGVAALPDGRFLTVWEGARLTANGHKREIFARYADPSGSPVGTPVLIARMGGADDATQDAADPVVTALSNGTVAVAFSGDVKPDANAVVPGDTVDLTNWQVFAAIIDPARPLGPVTPVQVTNVGQDTTTPASSDARFDQQYPDVTEDHGRIRLVWQGDDATRGDGNTDVWTTLRAMDLSPDGAHQRLTTDGVNTRPRVASLTDGGATRDALVVFERAAGGLRRAAYVRLDGTSPAVNPVEASGEVLMPDVAATGDSYAIVVSVVGPSPGLTVLRGAKTPGPTAWTPAYGSSTGAPDTWPSVVADAAQPGQFVVSWARRTATAGTGHYEVMSGRVRDAGPSALTDVQQTSSVDGNMSDDNAESLRPAIASQGGGTLLHAWGRVRNTGGAGVAIRRTAARIDLFASVTASPARPSPARAGINPADEVTVTWSYGNAAASDGSAPARITTTFPGFTATGTTITATSGPTPVETVTPGVFTVGRLQPGQGGTITVRGTLDAAAEGTIRTATGTITSDGFVIDDPSPLNDSATTSVTVDHPLAVTAITRQGANPSNAAAVSWDVTFDQVPTGFAASDVALTTTGAVSASVTSVTCAGTTCTVTASVAADSLGTLGLNIPAAATATDPQGKPLATGNLPFVGTAFDVDRVAPTVTTTALGPDPTNAAVINFRLDYTEPVTTPVPGNLDITGGTFAGATRTNGGPGPVASWTVGVTPTADGVVSLTPLAGSSSDPAGNPSVAGIRDSRTSDRTRPVITLTGPGAPQNGPYDVAVSASESVTGLTAGDFTVAGGTAGTLSGTGPWTLRVTPTTEGDVVVDLPAGSAEDAATNTSAAASTTTTYDVTPPTVSVTSTAGDPTGDSPIVFTVTFSEPVTGLTVEELVVSGGTAALVGSGATRTVSVTPTVEGPVSVHVPAGVASDDAGNPNTAGNTVTRTFDPSSPTPTITSSVGSPTNAATLPVTVTWDEDITGFAEADVTVANGGISGWSLTGRTVTFDVTPAASGDVVVAIPAGAAQDLAGNASLAATPLTVRVDHDRPSVTLSAAAADPTSAASLAVTVAFDEPVSGLSLDDFTTANASVSDLSGSGSSWSVVLAPVAEGSFSLQLPAGAVTDAAGNTSTASNLVERVSDRTATASLTYGGATAVNGAIALDLSLSDPATITAADFDVVNGTVGVSGSGRTWTVTLTPVADGLFSARLRAGAFTDAAGNTSSASQVVEVTFDGTAPTVANAVAPAVATGPFTVSVTFSEAVTGLDTGLVSVTNGTAGPATGSGTDWTFPVAPQGDGSVTVSFGAGAAVDAVGNPSAAYGPLATTVDSTAPTVTLSSPTAAVVNTSPIPVEVVFSEPVTGFGLDDLVLTNATATNLAGGGNRWTLDLVPATDGTVTASVAPAAAQDQAGNASLASGQLKREFDTVRPTLALTTPAGAFTRLDRIPVTATFSKAVLGFTQSDLVPSGGASVEDFTQLDPRTWTFVLVPPADGIVSVDVPAGAAASAGGNLAFGGRLAVTVDRVAPTLEVTGPRAVTGLAVVFDIAASESVAGLDGTDLRATGTARPGEVTLRPTSDTTWTATVTGMRRAGTVELSVRPGAAADAAGNETAAVSASSRWRPYATSLGTFELLKAPGVHDGGRLTLPVRVDVDGPISISATSSNPRLLRASAITLTGSGSSRQLTLLTRPRAGSSEVVVTAGQGGTTRRIRFTLIAGTRGPDRLVGGSGTDVMIGRGGKDVLVGRGGDDDLYGGKGRDLVKGGGGADMLFGGAQRDRVRGGAGADLFVLGRRDRALDLRPVQGDQAMRPNAATSRVLLGS